MGETYTIYCDESCHLEHDHQPVMVLGALLCPRARSREIADRIRLIKRDHGLAPNLEIKWSKVSKAKQGFYSDVIDFFLDANDLGFRAVIVPDKSLLNHAAHLQDHDTFYYKMYFLLLNVLIDPASEYRIYLDVKDTKSAGKVRLLQKDPGQQHPRL